MISTITFIAGVMVGLGGPGLLVWLQTKVDPEGSRQAHREANLKMIADLQRELRDL